MPFIIEITDSESRRIRGYLKKDQTLGAAHEARSFRTREAAADVAGECTANGDGLILTRVVDVDAHGVEKKPTYAFTALVNQSKQAGPFTIGRVDLDIPGFTPIDIGFPTYERARAHARLLNEDLGLTEQQAAEIVLSTMRFVPR